MDEQIRFIGAEDRYDAEQYTFKEIVMRQVNRITELGSREFYGGYYRESISGSRSYRGEYVQDSGNAYQNAVKVLFDLLLPEFDEEMKKDNKQLNSELNSELSKTKVKYYGKGKKESLDDWREFKIEWHRKLFQALSRLLSRKKYFEQQSLSE